MQKITLYREDNGQYSTSEAKQDDISGVYIQVEEIEQLKQENAELRISAGIAASFAAKVRMLNDIKADAINSLTEQRYGYIVEIGGCTDEWVISVDQILEHAEKLRNKQ